MNLPHGIKGLLTNQIGIHDMTAEAILHKSRDLVVQALLVDPIVTISKGIPELVDNMIAIMLSTNSGIPFEIVTIGSTSNA